MIGIAMALQSAMMPPAPPAVTPGSRTALIVDASCKISDAQGRRYDLSIHQSGGRGYGAVQKDGSSFFPRTPIRHDVVRDTAGIFDGLQFQIDSGPTWPGRDKAWKQGGPFVQIETMETNSPGKFAILIRKPEPFAGYVGFCDVTKSSQAPLSDAEAEKVGSK